jgi:hypothetical protein
MTIMRPVLRVQYSLRNLVFKDPIAPQDFCTIWVPKMFNHSPGERGYRSAAIDLLQKVLLVSAREADRLLSEPTDLTRSRSLIKSIGLKQQHVLNLLSSHIAIPPAQLVTPLAYCQNWLPLLYEVQLSEWGGGKIALIELAKLGLCPKTVKNWGTTLKCNDQLVMSVMGRQHLINYLDQHPEVSQLAEQIEAQLNSIQTQWSLAVR